MPSSTRPIVDYSVTLPPLAVDTLPTRDLIASTAIHELREPVQAIMSFLGVLLDGRAGQVSDLQRDFLATADQATRRLNRRIDDLHLVLTESHDVSIRPEQVDLLNHVAVCCNELSLIAASYGVQIDVRTHRLLHWPKIMADPERLDQIILNIVENAIQYSVRGSTVRVTVSPASPSSWRVTVENTAADDIKEDPATWFEPQRRGHCGTTTRKSGLGIGLAAAAKLTRAQAGEITAKVRRRAVAISVVFPAQVDVTQD